MKIENLPEKYREDIKKATYLLKNAGSSNVYLFGSMVTGKIHDNSDIDIGIKGLPPEEFFKVYSKLYMNFNNEIDLIDFDDDDDMFLLLERLGEVVEVG
ncbi:MAG: nucleotidyltransferase domain-containing protein [Lachnospiraceae bacterium]|jgi:predicted nucleotidyltransferase|nr:nucleotidyltransferase domain-containing protein [Lachnospiraceae bacterium]